MLDEISDNDIEDIEDDKMDSKDETMELKGDDDVDEFEFDGEITEEKLAAIKVITYYYCCLYIYITTFNVCSLA